MSYDLTALPSDRNRPSGPTLFSQIFFLKDAPDHPLSPDHAPPAADILIRPKVGKRINVTEALDAPR